jgi:hypothetical protein
MMFDPNPNYEPKPSVPRSASDTVLGSTGIGCTAIALIQDICPCLPEDLFCRKYLGDKEDSTKQI